MENLGIVRNVTNQNVSRLYRKTKSRTTNISEPTTLRKSTVSNTPSFSNSFPARRDNFLFIVDSRCSKHMTGNLMLKSNFMEKFLGMVKFGNDQIASILGYKDLLQGNVTIKRVYYVKGLNHNLFSVGQFYDSDLEVAFRKSTLAKASSSQTWLWRRRLSHLNFDTINLLSKYDIVIGLPKLKFVKDHLCSSCKLGKAKLRTVQTDKSMEFLNKTLHAYFAQEGIEHQTSTARTPEQNNVFEGQNRTLVEAARIILSAAKGLHSVSIQRILGRDEYSIISLARIHIPTAKAKE
ncbi:integrase, catalytic region, zinc finger, CCHC-type containing protein [Tanacetum coccineum]